MTDRTLEFLLYVLVFLFGVWVGVYIGALT